MEFYDKNRAPRKSMHAAEATRAFPKAQNVSAHKSKLRKNLCCDHIINRHKKKHQNPMARRDLERRSTSASGGKSPRHRAISSTTIEKRCFPKKRQTRWQTAIKTPNDTRTRAANQGATTSFEPKNVSKKKGPIWWQGRNGHTFLWGAFCANPHITA